MTEHRHSTERENEGGTVVVLDPEDPEGSLRAALPALRDTDDRITLILMYDEETLRARRRMYREAGISGPLSITQMESKAQRVLARLCARYFDDEPDLHAIAGVGESSAVREVVRRHSRAHVYHLPRSGGLWDRIRRLVRGGIGIDHDLFGGDSSSR